MVDSMDDASALSCTIRPSSMFVCSAGYEKFALVSKLIVRSMMTNYAWLTSGRRAQGRVRVR
jgi:hypothetical protein